MIPSSRSVAVFCGARPGNDPACRAVAATLGRGLAEAGLGLVYGGGRIGMMGALADAALAHGGRVTGVIPDFLMRREIGHRGLSELVVTDSMHGRKQNIAARVDAFVALPGGLGTFDELIEIITWRQLGLHDKPILLCGVRGAAGTASTAPFMALIEATIAAGFAGAEARRLFEVTDDVPALLGRLRHLVPTQPIAADRL